MIGMATSFSIERAGLPFFFKQWGGVFKKSTGRVLDGRTWDDMPAAASNAPESTAALE